MNPTIWAEFVTREFRPEVIQRNAKNVANRKKNTISHTLGRQKYAQMHYRKIETRTLDEVKEVLHYASQNETSVTRIMLDNMVVPLPNGDVDVSMLMINGRFETERCIDALGEGT